MESESELNNDVFYSGGTKIIPGKGKGGIILPKKGAIKVDKRSGFIPDGYAPEYGTRIVYRKRPILKRVYRNRHTASYGKPSVIVVKPSTSYGSAVVSAPIVSSCK